MKIRKQKGLSLIGFLLVLALAIFATFIAMRIVPIYLEYWSVVNAMNNVRDTPGSAGKSLYDIRVMIHNNLYVSYSDNNIRDNHIRVVRTTAGPTLRIAYEVRKPLIGNLDVVASFDRSVLLR